MTMQTLALTIVITIAYLMYSVYQLFVTKKKKKLTILDFVYFAFFTVVTGVITKMLIIIFIGGLLAMWLFILLYQANKNSQEK